MTKTAKLYKTKRCKQIMQLHVNGHLSQCPVVVITLLTGFKLTCIL